MLSSRSLRLSKRIRWLQAFMNGFPCCVNQLSSTLQVQFFIHFEMFGNNLTDLRAHPIQIRLSSQVWLGSENGQKCGAYHYAAQDFSQQFCSCYRSGRRAFYSSRENQEKWVLHLVRWEIHVDKREVRESEGTTLKWNKLHMLCIWPTLRLVSRYFKVSSFFLYPLFQIASILSRLHSAVSNPRVAGHFIHTHTHTRSQHQYSHTKNEIQNIVQMRIETTKIRKISEKEMEMKFWDL